MPTILSGKILTCLDKFLNLKDYKKKEIHFQELNGFQLKSGQDRKPLKILVDFKWTGLEAGSFNGLYTCIIEKRNFLFDICF